MHYDDSRYFTIKNTILVQLIESSPQSCYGGIHCVTGVVGGSNVFDPTGACTSATFNVIETS
jgi:hypothetical protein